MKLKAVNPDHGMVAVFALTACMVLSSAGMLMATSPAQALESGEVDEYGADGETTIETINGLRIMTLRQNVFVHQDGVELTGDVAVLEYNLDNELQKVRLTGTPAHFLQKPEADGLPITGSSDTINYYAGAESVVEFIGSAMFNQPGTKLQCAEIRHVIETGATLATGPCSGSLSPQTNGSQSSPAGPQNSTGAASPQPN